MNRVLAAVDGGPSTASVIDVGRSLVDVLGAELDVVTTGDWHDAVVALLDGWPIRCVEARGGDVWLTKEACGPDVVATVVATHALPGALGVAGHLPRHLIENCPGLVVAVPPDLAPGRRGLDRLLVPVEGDQESSEALVEVVAEFQASGRTIIGLHVLNRGNTPAFADRWDDPSMWSDAFWGTHAPMITHTHITLGDVLLGVLDVIRDHDADAVLLEWGQHLEDDRGLVVKDVLRHCPVPVLLVPHRPPPSRSTPAETVIDITTRPGTRTAVGNGA